jgi:hypothetical protein
LSRGDYVHDAGNSWIDLPLLEFGVRTGWHVRRFAGGAAGVLLRWQSWHWRSGKLSVLGMFAWRWAAAKVGGGFKRAMNAANEPTNVAEELPAAVVGPGTSPTDGILQ